MNTKMVILVVFLSILSVLSIGVIVVLVWHSKNIQKLADGFLTENDKYRKYMGLLNHWLYLRLNNIMLSSYFMERGYKKIAIYGMGVLGGRLYQELQNSNVEVEFVIDRNATMVHSEVEVVKPEDFPTDRDIDLIVITVNASKEALRGIIGGNTPMVYMDEILNSV